MYSKLVLEKIKAKSNLIFLLVFILINIVFFTISLLEGIIRSELNTLYTINGKFFYISILVAFSTEKTSGFLSKQLSNGLSRKDVFIHNQLQLFILAAFYYLFSTTSLFCISLYVLEDVVDFNRFVITIISFTTLAQLAYLFILFFKKTVYAVIVPYMIFLSLDYGILDFLMRYSHNDFIYLLPHGISLSLPKFYTQDNFNMVIFTLLIFNVLIPVLSYFKLMKTNFFN